MDQNSLTGLARLYLCGFVGTRVARRGWSIFFEPQASNKLVLFFKVLDGFIFSVFTRAPSVRFTPNLM
jgi:hypothetical protein